jgi:hypothetical protein
MRRALLAATAAALLGAVPAASAQPAPCEPNLKGSGVTRVEGARYVLAWRAVPPIQVSEFFTLEIAVCPREGQPRPATLRVDADMPAHKHGMNYRPSVRPQGPERFVAEGLMFHMPGQWELTFDVNVGAARETLRSPVRID